MIKSSISASSGFTLVELAIVMTIIGLLIGGILKGQELRQKAALTATLAQVDSYRAAVTQFRDAYSYLPGDFPRASTRIPGCTSTCDPDLFGGGDGVISHRSWGQWYHVYSSAHLPSNAGGGQYREAGLFWAHLVMANLISGSTSEALTAQIPQAGVTHPALKSSRGSWMIGYSMGDTPPTGSPATTGYPSGNFLMAASDQYSGGNTAYSGAFTSKEAAYIDRKVDDGAPASGFVFAVGLTTACFTSASVLAYDETLNGNSCDLLFRLF